MENELLYQLMNIDPMINQFIQNLLLCNKLVTYTIIKK